ncbi:putative regulatory protein [Yersinia frederiksenii]|nr:transcriptional regulator [Yersinia frederiksenii]CNC48153.1 putative regulatory protein [Yersinia frederiksenii]
MKMIRKTYVVNDYAIDLISGFITHRKTGETKRLGEYQLKLITVLLEHVGEILSRDEITNLVWHRRVIGNNSLPNAIHTLRVALGDENKQQRIIQTIPKLGYLLDPEFCEIIEENSEDSVEEQETALQEEYPANSLNTPQLDESQNLNPISLADQQSTTAPETIEAFTPHINHNEEEKEEQPPSTSVVEQPPAQMTAPPKRSVFNYWIILLLVLLVIVIGTAGGYILYQKPSSSNYQAVEQDLGMYSNIRIFQLVDSQLSLQDKEKLNQRLKDTFYMINKQIKLKNTHINVYYFVSLRRLDFNFSVENQCENKQLSMTIYHWRQSEQLLNNLIYREMERKANEMAQC